METKDLDVSPYEKYRYVAFSLDEFLGMVQENRRYFINYCEIVITANGLIFLASPSHDTVLKWLKKKGFFNCISVWYNNWVLDDNDKPTSRGITDSQRRVLMSLINHGIISYFRLDYVYC